MVYLLPDRSRLVPLRYFNLLRLMVAGLFLVAGRELNLGNEAPRVFMGVSFAYLAAVLTLGFPDAIRRLGLERLLTVQVAIDIVMLSAVMWASGGYASGMPVMMMVFLAAAGLVAEGRMVLFFAALATVSVLAENAWRALITGSGADFLQVGIVCIGFFAIALTARLLARRAKANESLAELRGEALEREHAINERIIEDMQDGVIVLGGDGRVRQTNPRAAQLIGVDLHPGLLLGDVDPALLDCARRCAQGEGLLQRFGPAGKMLRCRAVHAHAGDGKGGNIVVYLTDYEEIQKQAQQLKLAALGRLTASMAHEIRNPLAAVTQAADLLREEKRAEVQTRLTRIINDNSRRIERMVRDVLALGRRDELMREPLPLAVFVNAILEEFSLRGEDEYAIFRVDIAPRETLVIDRAHLHQILSNLLLNARRYCSGQPGAIRIFASQAGGGRTALHVLDDGPGLDEKQRTHLFEPFFTTDPKGTGLGMYIARELAEANDASLEQRDNDPGAHFVLTGRSLP
jgi:two-component system, NtrC family, sensor histidine kinase PilS